MKRGTSEEGWPGLCLREELTDPSCATDPFCGEDGGIKKDTMGPLNKTFPLEKDPGLWPLKSNANAGAPLEEAARPKRVVLKEKVHNRILELALPTLKVSLKMRL